MLRDELARVVAEVRKRDAALERQSMQNERLRMQIGQLRMQNGQLGAQPGGGGGRIACCENPHGPPSANSMPERRKKRAPGRDPADYKKPGRRGPGGPAAVAGPMEAAAAPVARRFGLRPAGRASAAKLANAAPFLFTFVNRPGAGPANDGSERMPGRAAMARKIRPGIASPEGARMFPGTMTCVPTWRKRSPDAPGMLLKAPGGT